MSSSILSDLLEVYFERYPTQSVTNDQLGDTKGFSPEFIADVRWYKEKLIIKRTKEALEVWLSQIEGSISLEALVQLMPKFDVVPALESDLQDSAMKVVNFLANPPQSPHDPATMVFKPLSSSNAYSLTFHHNQSFGSEDIISDVGSKARQEEHRGHRKRVKAYRGEVETLGEQRARREQSSQVA